MLRSHMGFEKFLRVKEGALISFYMISSISTFFLENSMGLIRSSEQNKNTVNLCVNPRTGIVGEIYPYQRYYSQLLGPATKRHSQNLKSRKIFFSQEIDHKESGNRTDDDETGLRLPEQSSFITDDYRDEDKVPLFPDLLHGHTPYVSVGYDGTDLSVLKRLSTKDLCFLQIFLSGLSKT